MENSLWRYSLNSRNAAMIKTGFVPPGKEYGQFQGKSKVIPPKTIAVEQSLIDPIQRSEERKDCEGKSVRQAMAWSRIPLTNRLQAKTDGVNQYSSSEYLEVDFHEVMDLLPWEVPMITSGQRMPRIASGCRGGRIQSWRVPFLRGLRRPMSGHLERGGGSRPDSKRA